LPCRVVEIDRPLKVIGAEVDMNGTYLSTFHLEFHRLGSGVILVDAGKRIGSVGPTGLIKPLFA
jgi:hypothetical protein